MSNVPINCFVIMPYSQSSDLHTEEYWQNHYNKFLKPIIENVPRLIAHRVEELRGDILKQIITDLVVSPIVVADLTDYNPNVFWELGVRQSFKHNTITIAEEGTILPFDVTSKATLFYNKKNGEKKERFNSQFKEALQDCINNPDKSDSHVLETISGRGSLFEIMKFDEMKRRVEGLIAECKNNYYMFEQARKAAFKVSFDSELPSEILLLTLLTSSVDLLLSTRYLEEDEKFYHIVREYNNHLHYLNSRIVMLASLKGEKRNFLLISTVKQKENGITNRFFSRALHHFERINKKIQEKIQLIIGI